MKKVCVIGAGPSGITALKNLLDQGGDSGRAGTDYAHFFHSILSFTKYNKKTIYSLNLNNVLKLHSDHHINDQATHPQTEKKSADFFEDLVLTIYLILIKSKIG
ncbi:MAG: hypothetical protein ACKOUQ_01650 [Aquirufa sp.]